MGYLLIGKFVKPFGVKGEMKIDFYVDSPEEVFDFEAFFMKDKLSPSGYKKFEWKSLRETGDRFIGRPVLITDRNVAETWRGREIFIDEEDLSAAEDGEYYIRDLLNCEVFQDGEKRGFIGNVLDIADKSVLVVELPEKKQVAIPFNDDELLEVDIEAKKITVRSIEDFQ